MFLAGSPNAIYWHPHFCAVVVLAVRADCPYPVRGWQDLAEDVRIVLPAASPERELFTLALTRGSAAEPRLDSTLAFFNRLRQEGRLVYHSLPIGDPDLSDETHRGDVYVLFSYQAEQLIRAGAPLRICIPQEGTLTFSKGILSHAPLTFHEEDLAAKLSAFGYTREVPPSAAPVSDLDAFLKDTNRVRHLSQEHDRTPLRWLMVRARDDRFFLLVFTLAVTVFWSGTIWQRVLHRGTRRAVLLLAAMLLLWELDRMARLFSPSFDMAFQNFLWYFYYVFRAGLPVALLWISWASDEERTSLLRTSHAASFPARAQRAHCPRTRSERRIHPRSARSSARRRTVCGGIRKNRPRKHRDAALHEAALRCTIPQRTRLLAGA